MYLSIIIPAYNEEKRIAKTLIAIDHYMRQQKFEYEILVVNDGSKDKTASVVTGLTSKIPHLKLIDNKENIGKGYVVRQGLLKGIGDYRLFMDADNATDINEIEKLFPYLKNGYDIAIASRSLKDSIIINPQPWQRRFLGIVYRTLVIIFTGLSEFKDTQCGFKMFTSKSAQDVLLRCKINGLSFDVEILAIAKQLHYKVKEVPVSWTNDDKSTISLKSMAKAIFDLVRV